MMVIVRHQADVGDLQIFSFALSLLHERAVVHWAPIAVIRAIEFRCDRIHI